MKPVPPPAPPQHYAAPPDEAETTPCAPQQMRQILHAMGLYLDSLQARASIKQKPVLSYLQDSVLSLGNLLDDLNETSVRTARIPARLPSLGLLGMRCLVISDNPQAMQFAFELLQAWGCEVHGASSLVQASTFLCSANPYEVVLCDLYQQERYWLLALLEQVHRLQPGALPIVVEVFSVVRNSEFDYPTRLPRPLAPAKLRACLLASRLRV